LDSNIIYENIFQLNRAMVGPNFVLVRASSDEAIVLRVEKVSCNSITLLSYFLSE